MRCGRSSSLNRDDCWNVSSDHVFTVQHSNTTFRQPERQTNTYLTAQAEDIALSSLCWRVASSCRQILKLLKQRTFHRCFGQSGSYEVVMDGCCPLAERTEAGRVRGSFHRMALGHDTGISSQMDMHSGGDTNINSAKHNLPQFYVGSRRPRTRSAAYKCLRTVDRTRLHDGCTSRPVGIIGRRISTNAHTLGPPPGGAETHLTDSFPDGLCDKWTQTRRNRCPLVHRTVEIPLSPESSSHFMDTRDQDRAAVDSCAKLPHYRVNHPDVVNKCDSRQSLDVSQDVELSWECRQLREQCRRLLAQQQCVSGQSEMQTVFQSSTKAENRGLCYNRDLTVHGYDGPCYAALEPNPDIDLKLHDGFGCHRTDTKATSSNYSIDSSISNIDFKANRELVFRLESDILNELRQVRPYEHQERLLDLENQLMDELRQDHFSALHAKSDENKQLSAFKSGKINSFHNLSSFDPVGYEPDSDQQFISIDLHDPDLSSVQPMQYSNRIGHSLDQLGSSNVGYTVDTDNGSTHCNPANSSDTHAINQAHRCQVLLEEYQLHRSRQKQQPNAQQDHMPLMCYYEDSDLL